MVLATLLTLSSEPATFDRVGIEDLWWFWDLGVSFDLTIMWIPFHLKNIMLNIVEQMTWFFLRSHPSYNG